LLRAARAFLDPELQMGKVTLAEATRVLMEDVVTSEAMARQETDRYTFRSPGQAISYFYGYVKLVALRKEIEQKLGPKFSAIAFHDFILDQGLLPPALLPPSRARTLPLSVPLADARGSVLSRDREGALF
jgi:uncharacterized protein (DUF885 family)